MPAQLGPFSPTFLFLFELTLLASAWVHVLGASVARFGPHRTAADRGGGPDPRQLRRAATYRRLAITTSWFVVATLPILVGWSSITS